MKTITFCIVFLSFSLIICGQNSNAMRKQNDALSSLQNKESTGVVSFYLDTLIQENYNKHLIQNSKNQGISGYRIRIFSDNGLGAKDKQKRVKASFLSLFPEIPIHDDYKGSYFKLYVGDFRTKRDALKALDIIKHRFPDAFIVEDNILIEG